MFSALRLCIGSINYGTLRYYSASQEARILKSLLDKNKKKKNKLNQTRDGSSNLVFDENGPLTNKNFTLNKIYMHNISELFPSIESGNKLLELGLNISKVNVISKSGIVNVFWYSYNPKIKNEELKDLLNETAKQLGLELGLLSNSRRIAQIRFLRDVSYEKAAEIERIFESPEFKKDLKLAESLIDTDLDVDAEVDETKIPRMRNDLFGLDHEKVYEKILVEKKKKSYEPRESDVKEENVISWPLIKFDKKSYEKFYRKKKALREKLLKSNESSIYNPANDMIFEREPEIDWEYEEHEEEIDLKTENENYLQQKQKMGQKVEIREENL